MSSEELGVFDGHLVLKVLLPESDLTQEPTSATLEELPRLVEVAPLTGVTPQLRERHLDLRVTVDLLHPAGAEDVADVVRGAHGDIDEGVSARGTAAGQTCLDEVPEELDRRVPKDVAVVSFDNWKILATGAVPQLTSVDMNFQTMGRLAARKLFNAMAGQEEHGVFTQPCRLVVRGSTVDDS